MNQDKYLEFLDTLIELSVADHSVVALLMEKFPELGITGAMLIVEYAALNYSNEVADTQYHLIFPPTPE